MREFYFCFVALIINLVNIMDNGFWFTNELKELQVEYRWMNIVFNNFDWRIAVRFTLYYELKIIEAN